MRYALLFLLLAACEGPVGPVGPEGPEGPPATVVIPGTYRLVRWNGMALPALFSTLVSPKPGKLEIVDGWLSLNENRTYVRTTAWRETTDTVRTWETTVAGSYTKAGDYTVMLGTATAVIGRDALTLNPVGAETYVYLRQ